MTADDIIRVTRLLDNHIQILKFGQRQSRKEQLYPSLISLLEAFSPHNKVFLSIPKAVETKEEKDHQHIESLGFIIRWALWCNGSSIFPQILCFVASFFHRVEINFT